MKAVPPHPNLNSIFVYDTDCGDIYINNENPTEYKPVGIDILEKLIPILTRVSQQITSEINSYTTQKINIDSSLILTNVAQWYSSLESKERSDIDQYIQFDSTNMTRMQELYNLINTNNPQQVIKILTNLKFRVQNFYQQIEQIEILFNKQNVEEFIKIRDSVDINKKAYDIASRELTGINTINGFGTTPWRVLWDAAKNFAHSAGLSDGQNFPSLDSLEKCVLCQQSLDIEAKNRLVGFNKFIINDITTQLNIAQNAILKKIDILNAITIPPLTSIPELSQFAPGIEEKYAEFTQFINQAKAESLSFLHNGEKLNVSVSALTVTINNAISAISTQIEQNNQLIQNKNVFIAEYNELKAKEFLFLHKDIILRYFDEFKYKNWLNTCQSLINTASISRKIGELVADQAVSLQHQEFINHLNSFNVELASRVLLSKTRTSQGNTFQQCKFAGFTDAINLVLSEGEQKIIALSNFLAECTIDGRQNTIIFDDPVNSLDMNYRELISNKIVELSENRQIILFTHDLYFLRLLIDTYKEKFQNNCNVICIDKYNEISGIITDEIPYLVKNVQERIDSIRKILVDYDACKISDSRVRESMIDSACKKFRMLLERTVEEVLSNKAYERFSKNIHLKKSNLSSYVVTEKSDIDFLLNLFGKYSVAEHDGGTSTIHKLPSRIMIENDIREYSDWKNVFKEKLRLWKDANGYQ